MSGAGRSDKSSDVLGVVSPYDSSGLVTGYVVKASSGVLYSVFGYNNAAAVRYVQLFNLAAVPLDGVVPDFVSVPIPAGSPFSITFVKGWVASSGIVLVSSSTLLTKTITGVADVWFSGEFE